MATPGGSTPAPIIVNTTTQRPPSLCMKPLPSSNASSPGVTSPPISLTTKEWIVPPRPKPGRKPATDTPPTKRKAQNRAAQRAFRERRAARVGELEEQMKEIEDQHDEEQETLRIEVANLEKNLEQCQADLSSWIAKYHKLEAELSHAQQQLLKQRHTQPSQLEQSTHPDALGCGNCTMESHCQCIDDVVQGINDQTSTSVIHSRPCSPDDINNKRIKLESSDSGAMEIDFTAAFAKIPHTAKPNHTSAEVLDPCGFCQDGSPCICAEMAAEQQHHDMTRPSSPMITTRGAPAQMAQFTPPPSEGDVANSILPTTTSCTGVPGTCAQCVADPNSTLFCKSLAASRQSGKAVSGCCGGRGADGGCCQSSVPLPPRTTRSGKANAAIRLPEPSRNPVTLSCADAYTALSRHSAYEQASGDMASWMPKLHASPASVEGRPAMEIDAANVMAVLKDFDRRFGSRK